MKLRTQDSELKNPNWEEIKAVLNKFDDNSIDFLILENENDDYIQCAGFNEKLEIEYRLNSKPKFRHYILGKVKNKSPLKVNWVVLQTNIGQIMVHEEEVLNIKDAESIFQEFYYKNIIPENYNKRNVTKLYL